MISANFLASPAPVSRALAQRLVSAEALVEGIAGAAHGADRVGGAAAVERAAQPPDVHVDGALVDIDVAAPHAVEQLLAREHPARALHQELEQAELGRPEVHLAARARHAPGVAVELEVAGGKPGRDPLGPGAAQ